MLGRRLLELVYGAAGSKILGLTPGRRGAQYRDPWAHVQGGFRKPNPIPYPRGLLVVHHTFNHGDLADGRIEQNLLLTLLDFGGLVTLGAQTKVETDEGHHGRLGPCRETLPDVAPVGVSQLRAALGEARAVIFALILAKGRSGSGDKLGQTLLSRALVVQRGLAEGVALGEQPTHEALRLVDRVTAIAERLVRAIL